VLCNYPLRKALSSIVTHIIQTDMNDPFEFSAPSASVAPITMSEFLPGNQVRGPPMSTPPLQPGRGVHAPGFFGLVLALLGLTLLFSSLIAVLVVSCRPYRKDRRAVPHAAAVDIEMARCSDETDRTFGTTDSGVTLCIRKPSPVKRT
jgi:hypothetical protein